MKPFVPITFAALALHLAGAAAGSSIAPIDVQIRWTKHGVPHIQATDYRSLGYGYGYAVAPDRLCLLADRVITLRGERSRWHGDAAPATVGFLPTTNLNADLFHRVQLSDESVAGATAELSADARALADGYALGFNRYVDELPKDARMAACGGAPIVPMKGTDVVRAMMSIGTIWKSFQIAPHAADSAWGGTPSSRSHAPAAAMPRPSSTVGSNAWAYGGDATRTGGAIVLANPHTFWQDNWLLMHQMHLTLPGKLDVAGADFAGLPLPVVGFNADVAWSIEAPVTVTYFVMQKMQVDERRDGHGTRGFYVIDGEYRPLRIVRVPVEVKQPDGTLARREFPIAWSELGALYRLPAAPGRPQGWYAVTDAGQDNARGLDQMLAIAKAKSVAEFRDATQRHLGLGSHLVAGDRHGDALYVEAGPLLDIDASALGACGVKDAMPTILDGSRSACTFRDGQGRPRLVPPSKLPALVTRGIVQNTNNSYHLSIHDQAIDGYPALLGEAGQHDLRIQMSEKRMKEVTADGRVTPDETLAVVFDDRNYAAETWLDDLLTACSPAPSERAARGCAILKRWDKTNDAQSRGTLLFETLWPRLAQLPDLLSKFDAQQPFAPRKLSTAPAALTAIAKALDEAVQELEALGLRGDEPWGSILATRGASGKVALHGGAGEAGVLNALGGAALSKDGYAAIISGSAYLQRVQWRDGRVVADVVLAHGQSLDAASPHHVDQLELFARKQLAPLPFSAAEITAATEKTLQLRANE